MNVWIDGEQCSGVALCEDACPQVFAMAGDGIAHVKAPNGQLMDDRVPVPFDPSLLESVIEAAEVCPQDCIFIES